MPQAAQPQMQGTQPDPETVDPRDRDWEPLPVPEPDPTTPAPAITEPPSFPGGEES